MYGMVKALKTDNGEIKLVGNSLTFLLYKSYFGRDLLNDIVSFATSNAEAEAVKKMSTMDIKTVDDINRLDGKAQAELLDGITDYKFDSEFILNFIAALMATARYPEKPNVMDLIMEIPPFWLADREIITELMSFLTQFVSQKKSR